MNLFSKYKNTAISSTDNVKQLLFILDEITKMLHVSRKALSDGDLDKKYNYLNKIVDIFYSLKSGLNTEGGGALIETLNNFYSIIASQLEKVNIISNNAEDITPFITAVSEIRNSISEAYDAELGEKIQGSSDSNAARY